MNLLIGIPALLALIEIRAQIDRYLIEDKNRYVNHYTRTIIQGSVMILITLITNMYELYDFKNIWQQLSFQTLTYFAIFWTIFDTRLNTLRGLHWLYVPSNPDHRSAITDRMLRAINMVGINQFNLKVGLIIIFAGFYYNY